MSPVASCTTVYSAICPNAFDGLLDYQSIDRDHWRGVVGTVVHMPLSGETLVVWEDAKGSPTRGEYVCRGIAQYDGDMEWFAAPQGAVEAVRAESGSKAATAVRKYFKKLGVM